MTGSYTTEQRVGVTWGQFVEMFHMEYVPLVEKERIVQEHLALRQTTESVIEITKIFTKRALFCLECFALELARMSRYMRMLKTGI